MNVQLNLSEVKFMVVEYIDIENYRYINIKEYGK